MCRLPLVAWSILLGAAPLHASEPVVVENTTHGLWDDTPRQNVHLLEELYLSSEDGEDAFGRIADVVVDSQGRWIILDSGFVSVHTYHPDSLTLRTFGGKGVGPGEFQQPSALGIDASNRIYVAGMDGRIAVFGPYGELEDEFKHKVTGGTVRDMAIVPSGLYIACFDAVEDKVVQRYDAGHEFLASFSSSWSAVKPMAPDEEFAFNGGAIDVDAQGYVYYTQFTPYEIRKFTPDGELVLVIHRQNTLTPPRAERQGDRTRFYSFGLSCGIFALPDGRIMNVAIDSPAEKGVATKTFVDLYQPDGKLLKSRALEGRVWIRFRDRRGRLYAVEERGVPQVVRYRLVFQ